MGGEDDRVDGVILSSLSSSRKFDGDEDRETECAERGRKKETKIERMTEIYHQVDRSVSERDE